MAALTALAALLRLPAITEFPPGLHGDEAWLGIEARRILAEGWIGFWTSAGWGQPTGVFYWTALAFSVLPDNVAVLRGSVAVLGALTVPALYLFVRSFFGWRAAMIAAGLLAVSYWHIHYSRTAFTLIAAPLVECVVLALLARGVQTRQGWLFFAAGLATGLGVYTYRGYLFFVVLLGVAWLFLLLRRPHAERPYPPRLLLSHAALFALPAAIAALPMAVFIATNYSTYMAYGGISTVFGSPWLADALQEHHPVTLAAYKLARALGIYYVGRERDVTDGLGEVSLLDPVTMLLFTTGVVLCLWRWRDWRHTVLIGGIALGAIAVAMTVFWGENRRGITALPMVFAAAGLGGDAILTWLLRLGGRFGLPQAVRLGALPAVAALALASAAVWNAWHYFGHIGNSEDTYYTYSGQLTEAAHFLASLDGNPHVYFYADRWPWRYESRRFQAPGIDGEDRSHQFGVFRLDRQPEHERVAYLLMPPYHRYLDEIQERYPGGEVVQRMDGDEVVFVLYLLEDEYAMPERLDNDV